MKDTVVGVFESRDAASDAFDGLIQDGWDSEQVAMRRVLAADYRGFADDEAVYELMHAPEMSWGTTLEVDAVVVDVGEEDNPKLAEARFKNSGASDVRLVAGTPPLDL
jgi:hypothetical protein